MLNGWEIKWRIVHLSFYVCFQIIRVPAQILSPSFPFKVLNTLKMFEGCALVSNFYLFRNDQVHLRQVYYWKSRG